MSIALSPIKPLPVVAGKPWWWGFGSEPETLNGPFGNRVLALLEALKAVKADNSDRVAITLCQGDRAALTDDIFDADAVIEAFDDWNDDARDPDGGSLIEATDAQRQELADALRDTLSTWRTKHGLGRAWAINTCNETVLSFQRTASGTYKPC